MKSGHSVGVMSGTNLDSIDVVLATVDEHRVTQLASLNWPIPVSLEQAILDICQGQQLALSQFGQFDTQFGRPFADAINTLPREQNLQARNIVATGCRGQTIWHGPTGVAPHTSQIGDSNQIVTRTGIMVVSNFRRRDTTLGGQDVPLVPTSHHVSLAHPTERRMMLNTGGIINLSLLIPGQPVDGYDIGPGSMPMGAWTWRQVGKPYDKDVGWARAGKVILPLLQNMLSDPYFSQSAPRSTGREHFNYGWLEHHLRHFPGVDPRDVQVTLAELTIVTIPEQVLLNGGCERLMACGGGSRNPLLMTRLAALLPDTEVTTTDAAGISGDSMGTLAFTWLTWRTLAGLPGNLPSVIGASQEMVLGVIFPTNP